MPTRSGRDLGELPVELNDLLTLHSSFLSALSIHYAHNGSVTPVDLRILNPSISQIWGKRMVTIDDIRLCVGVLAAGPSNTNPFVLSDYGYGKICLEIDEKFRAQGMAGPLNENALQAMFMECLEHLWKIWTENHTQSQLFPTRPIAQPKRRSRGRRVVSAQSHIEPFVDDASLPRFLTQLPHAEITLCASLEKVAPLREKGRKRLRDIKDSMEQARAAKKSRDSSAAYPEPRILGKENEPTPCATPAQVQSKITEFTQIRKTNLLDRIMAKQKAASLLPALASPAEQQRKAALQRAEDVLGVLALLVASKGASPRVSVSMGALCQALQGSIRSPISKEEAVKCVEVLAEEVAPGYVSLVKMGSICSVVVNRVARPHDIKGRLRELGAGL